MRQSIPGNESENTPPGEPVEADRAARIAQLFETHNQTLLRYLTCRLHSAQEAKEVAQEAYVRLLQLEATNAIGYLRAFLFKTAANLAADRLKSQSRRARLDRLDFFDDSTLAPSAETAVAAAQELSLLLQIVNDLPPKCRYAFVMHRFHNKNFAEIAAAMQLTERMVRIYVERALVFCRDRLMNNSSINNGRSENGISGERDE